MPVLLSIQGLARLIRGEESAFGRSKITDASQVESRTKCIFYWVIEIDPSANRYSALLTYECISITTTRAIQPHSVFGNFKRVQQVPEKVYGQLAAPPDWYDQRR